MKYLVLASISIILFASCASFPKSTNNGKRIMLDETNFKMLEGRYNIQPIGNKDSYDLMGSIFTQGNGSFDYSKCKNSLCYVQFEVLDRKTLLLSYNSTHNEIETVKLKGKFKDGYFVLKRKLLCYPFIVMNLFRNRKFRIGLLDNGNLITDHNQVSFGTVIAIIPFYENEKKFNVEYEKSNDDSKCK